MCTADACAEQTEEWLGELGSDLQGPMDSCCFLLVATIFWATSGQGDERSPREAGFQRRAQRGAGRLLIAGWVRDMVETFPGAASFPCTPAERGPAHKFRPQKGQVAVCAQESFLGELPLVRAFPVSFLPAA